MPFRTSCKIEVLVDISLLIRKIKEEKKKFMCMINVLVFILTLCNFSCFPYMVSESNHSCYCLLVLLLRYEKTLLMVYLETTATVGNKKKEASHSHSNYCMLDHKNDVNRWLKQKHCLFIHYHFQTKCSEKETYPFSISDEFLSKIIKRTQFHI